MLSTIIAGVVLSAVLSAPALANPQHERMRRCNAEAKEQSLKGDERKSFMSSCLRGKHDKTGVPSAQAGSDAQTALPALPELEAAERAKACNLAAVEQALSGDERQAYISECSKGRG